VGTLLTALAADILAQSGVQAEACSATTATQHRWRGEGGFQWCTWTNWRSNRGVTVFWRIPEAYLWRNCSLAYSSGVSGYFRLNSGVTVLWRIPVTCLDILD
ncbi:unnamed protein product, partial [Callosobruchus maculatus]